MPAGDRTALVFDAVGDGRPAVVAPLPRHVQFVAAARAVLDLPQFSGRRVQRRCLHVAMAVGPDLGPHVGLAHERIVLGHRSVRVEAHDLPEQAVEALCLHAAFGDRPLAERDEQRAVAAEDQASAEVQRRVERRRLTEDDLHVLDARARHRRPAGRARPRCCWCRCPGSAIAPVDQLILLERGIEHDVEQPALSARIHGGRPATGSDICLPSARDDAETAGLFGDQHAAVGQKRQAPRIDQPFGHRRPRRTRRPASARARGSARRMPASVPRRSAGGCSSRLPGRLPEDLPRGDRLAVRGGVCGGGGAGCCAER